MHFLHTMVRVADLEVALDFYVSKLGLVEIRRIENTAGRFTLVFLAAPDDLAGIDADGATTETSPALELTYNWDPEVYDGGRNFGHLAFAVDDIYAVCASLQAKGVIINRTPHDGRMAFIRSPDGISIELLQKGPALKPAEPWGSLPNTGSW